MSRLAAQSASPAAASWPDNRPPSDASSSAPAASQTSTENAPDPDPPASPTHALSRHEAHRFMLGNATGREWNPISLLSTSGNHSFADEEL